MREFIRGERAKLSELAAINHIWEVGVSIDAPFFIVDFCCLGLDEAGQVVDDRYLVSYNHSDSPNGAISMDNASNNGAFFTIYLERLHPAIRRVVFTATLHKPEIPGGLLGAAFSLFGPNLDIGEGHLMIGTPAVAAGSFAFSGNDFGEESTLILGEFYWRDEWRFVAAGQPLKGELDAFLRTLTDGPMPVPTPVVQPASISPSAPPRPPHVASPPSVQTHSPSRQQVGAQPVAPNPKSPIPVSASSDQVLSSLPLSQPVAQSITPQPPIAQVSTSQAPNSASLIVAPVFPQTVPRGGKLQDLIDNAATGSTLTLMRGEYQGPIRIDKPLIIEGRDSALWSRLGPVVTIAASGVELRNFDIEVTIAQKADDETGVAIKVETPNPLLELENVRLNGRISGLGAEDGQWVLPSKLDLGQFAPRKINDYFFNLYVPTLTTLVSPVEGVSLLPSQLEAGEHRIVLSVGDVPADSLLVGSIEVRSTSMVRTIPLSGNAVAGVEARQEVDLNPDVK